MKKSENPIKPPNLSAPYMNPHPIIQNTIEPMQKSMRFFMMIFVAFFALVSPVSTRAKPACMKNTRDPVSISHSMSMAFVKSFVEDWAATAAIDENAKIAIRAAFFRTMFLLWYAMPIRCRYHAKESKM